MASTSFRPRLDILPDAQRALWPELAATPPEFTLYGGTAIALQLGHRQSVDFDFFGSAAFAPDALVLGCTHYPILRDVIQQTVGADVKLVDSGEATAGEVAALLREKNLENPNAVSGERRLCDDLDHFYVTDAAERFARVATRFLGTQPSKLEAIEVYGGDELKKN